MFIKVIIRPDEKKGTRPERENVSFSISMTLHVQRRGCNVDLLLDL